MVKHSGGGCCCCYCCLLLLKTRSRHLLTKFGTDFWTNYVLLIQASQVSIVSSVYVSCAEVSVM